MPDITASIVATMRHPVLVLDEDLQVQLANRAFCNLFDVSSDETVNRPLTELGDGQWNLPPLLRLLREVRDTRAEIADFRVEHDFPRIGRRILLLNARCLEQDPGPDRVLLAIEDATERKRSLGSVQASEDRLRAVLETEGIGVLFFDGSGHIVGSNEAFLKLTGYSREEVESGKLHWRDLTPAEWVPDSEREIEKLARTGHIGPYEKEYLLRDGSRAWMMFAGRGLEDGTIVEFCIDVSNRKRAEQERELLAHELSHRVKNTLGVVQSLAMQMGEHADSVEDYQRVFLGRLNALARAQSLLTDDNWQSADLKQLVVQTTEAFRVDHPEMVELVGEPLTLTAKQALGLSLILHELGTNAAKFGALSRHSGRLRVSWDVEKTDEGPRVRLEWRERQGPVVKPPETKGFGMELIEGACAYELDGEARLALDPEGVVCCIAFPLNGPS